jgi:hypothetical protein
MFILPHLKGLTAGNLGSAVFKNAGLDLKFAENKSLVDSISGNNLITFNRAAPAGASTYVGSDGVLRSAVTNLQTWSEDFRNTADAGATRPWTYTTSAVTADNTTAPDGTSTADQIAGAAGTANKFLSNNISTTTTGFYTFSIYLKQGTEQFVVVRLTNGSANGVRGRFDLTAGTVVITNEGTATGQAASATAVGNGWYRCVVTCSVSSLPSSVMQPQLWLNNFASTSLTSNYFAWGAQLEQSSTVGEYVPTTSAINSAPRFDHNPTTGESLGLLPEEARTNSIRNNTMVGAVAGTPGTLPTNWSSFTSLTGLTRQIVGIGTEDGVAYIDIRLSGTPSAAGTYAFYTETSTGVAAILGQTWTVSQYIKLQAGTLTGINLVRLSFQENNSGGGYLTEQNTSVLTPTATSLVGQRVTASRTLNQATAAFLQPGFNVTLSGVAIDITLRIGLPQLELGAFATSVIPTTTATVTRAADVASITGSNFSSWASADKHTLYAEIQRPSAVNSNTSVASLSDGTLNNVVRYRLDSNGSTSTWLGVTSGTNDGVVQVTTGTAGLPIKAAGGAELNSYQLAVNGVLGTQDTSALMPSVNRLEIGAVGGIALFNGTIKRLTYWPTRLANTTLQLITQA